MRSVHVTKMPPPLKSWSSQEGIKEKFKAKVCFSRVGMEMTIDICKRNVFPQMTIVRQFYSLLFMSVQNENLDVFWRSPPVQKNDL